MKTFSHACGRDQVLQLQSYLGAFLWQSAFLEGIGELIVLADSHQKLRLREQRLRAHSMFFGCGRKCSEVHVGRYVLFSRCYVRIRTR